LIPLWNFIYGGSAFGADPPFRYSRTTLQYHNGYVLCRGRTPGRPVNSPPEEGCPQGGVVDLWGTHTRVSRKFPSRGGVPRRGGVVDL